MYVDLFVETCPVLGFKYPQAMRYDVKKKVETLYITIIGK